MTALPAQPHRLLTVADYLALGEEPDDVRYELQEGNLVMSPKPVPEHQIAVSELVLQLRGQVPDDLRAIFDIDVDLQLVPPAGPGTVRAPGIAVVTRAALARRRQQGGVIHANELRLAVEVVSPGSRRVDKVFNHSEYADAGIPHYWVVDLGEPGERTTLTAHHLAGAFGYADTGPVSGVFAATEPFPVRIDLDALV
jgi:Uma2 family endonuclease